MFSKYFIVEATVTPTNDAYQANDVIGGLVTFSLSGVVVNGGVLNKIVLIDDDSEAAVLNVYFFSAQPSTIADDAAFAPTAADLKKLCAVQAIAAADYTTVNSLDYAIISDINDVIQTDGKGNLYAYVECTGTPTYASGKTLFFRLFILSEE